MAKVCGQQRQHLTQHFVHLGHAHPTEVTAEVKVQSSIQGAQAVPTVHATQARLTLRGHGRSTTPRCSCGKDTAFNVARGCGYLGRGCGYLASTGMMASTTKSTLPPVTPRQVALLSSSSREASVKSRPPDSRNGSG